MGKVKYCKHCGRMIDFIITKTNGKPMPVDLPSVPYTPWIHGRDSVILKTGEVIRCEIENDPAPSSPRGYVPHFATCYKRKTENNRRSMAIERALALKGTEPERPSPAQTSLFSQNE